jgi:hypothetical protein
LWSKWSNIGIYISQLNIYYIQNILYTIYSLIILNPLQIPPACSIAPQNPLTVTGAVGAKFPRVSQFPIFHPFHYGTNGTMERNGILHFTVSPVSLFHIYHGETMKRMKHH